MVLLLLLFSACLCSCVLVHVFHLIARERFSISSFVSCLFRDLLVPPFDSHICFPSTRGCVCMAKSAQTSFRIYFLIILCRQTCNFLCFCSRRRRSVSASHIEFVWFYDDLRLNHKMWWQQDYIFFSTYTQKKILANRLPRHLKISINTIKNLSMELPLNFLISIPMWKMCQMS